MGFFDRWRLTVRTATHRPTYTAGDTVTGTVTLRVESPIECRAIRVVLTGEETCRVHTSLGRQTHDHTESKRIFHKTVTLFGATLVQPQKQALHVPAGEYVYPFAVDLPTAMLPTLGDARRDGRILYRAVGVASIAGGFDADDAAPFTVLRAAPRRQVADAPLKSEVTALQLYSACCPMCIRKGNIGLTMHVMRGVITKDEEIKFACGVEDFTDGALDTAVIEVLGMEHRMAKGYGGGKTHKIHRSVHRLTTGGKGKGTLIDATLSPIPADYIPTTTGLLLRMHYIIRVSFDPAGANAAHVDVPIIFAPHLDGTNAAPEITSECPLQREADTHEEAPYCLWPEATAVLRSIPTDASYDGVRPVFSLPSNIDATGGQQHAVTGTVVVAQPPPNCGAPQPAVSGVDACMASDL